MSELAEDRSTGTIVYLRMRTPGTGSKKQEDEVVKPIRQAKPGYEGRQKKGVGTRTMQPFEDYYQIRNILERLEYWGRYRDYALIMTGLATGLRISDLVRLKVKDVYDVSSGRFREVIQIKEKKTGKSTISDVDAMVITEAIVLSITKYFESMNWAILPDDPLFKSINMSKDGSYHLSECQGWRIVKGAAEMAKVDVKVGSHTLRKTFLNIANAVGTMSRLGNGNGMVLSDVMVLARHSKITTTLRYTTLLKSRLISLRKGVSAFLLGKTKIKSLKMEYDWQDDNI